jgi:hypothetical protein
VGSIPADRAVIQVAEDHVAGARKRAAGLRDLDRAPKDLQCPVRRLQDGRGERPPTFSVPATLCLTTVIWSNGGNTVGCTSQTGLSQVTEWLGWYNDTLDEARIGEFLRFVVSLLCHIIGQEPTLLGGDSYGEWSANRW